MLGRKRLQNRWFSSVAGLLVAVLLLQATHELLPNLIPPLISVAEAAYNTIQPDGDGTVAATRTTCATAANFDCLNDGVATSSTPSTSGDYLTFSGGNNDNYTMQTISNVSSVSAVYVPIYHRESGTNMTMSVSLWDAAQTTQYGTTQTFSNRSASQWDTATFSGLSLTQAQLDGMRVRITCTRSGGSSANRCFAYAMFAAVNYTAVINVTVGSLGTQQDIPITTTSTTTGGSFSIVENTSNRNITSIKISEQGTVDAQNNLDNIKLYYEIDNTSPYNCSGLSYDGTETQYGITDTDGFSGANGDSTFTGSVGISTTQAMCVYVVLDVLAGATLGQTLEIQITAPNVDVAGSGSPVISPGTAVLLPGTTTLRKQSLILENYHWRNDDGSESAATSATGGAENTPYAVFPKTTVKRLRLAVSNEGNKTSTVTQYRLEYATKVTTCAAATGWTDVGGAGGDFDMSNTGNLTDGNDTTNIAVATGGVSNPNTTFLTPNGGVRDTSSQTGNITLTSTEYVELEYAIQSSSGVTDGTTYCFRVTNAGTPLDGVTNYPEATIAADIVVSTGGTQANTVTKPASNQYVGGFFRLTDTTTGAGTVSSITITASGTVDIQNDLSNIKLRYDLDTSSPYTCDDVSYAAADTLYGSAVANFNGSNKAIFTGSVSNSPTQTVCLYVEYDVDSDASNGELLDIRIANPSTEVVISGSTVSPSSPVDISGVTTFTAPYVQQTGSHWRNNDGDQAAATSATGGSENTKLDEILKNTTYRIRFSLANTGLVAAPETRYRLEWAQKVTTCAVATSWTRVDTALDAWQMSPTGNLTEGNDTTDIAVAGGGVSNGAATFLANNNGINDTTDLTASSTLTANNYLDLEYSISATNNAVQGASYCFRVTSVGVPLDNYANYAEAGIKLDTDFKVQRGVSTIAGDNITITAGVDYEAPAAASSSFIRITNTQLTGAGPNTGNSNSNADDVTVYITNPGNIQSSITFARGTGAAGNTRVAWEIVEYTGVVGGENEIIVRRQEAVSYGSGNTTVSGAVTNSVVTDGDVAVFITGQFNADTGRNAYGQGYSIASWNGTNNQADFTRGLSGAVSSVSYAAIEFTGSNWKVQRISHTYTAAGSVETGSMTAVNSLSRTFIHTQKLSPSNNHADIGHEVWLSGIGQVSFLLDGAASTPGGHVSVAWVIENTQTQGLTMKVYRSNSSLASGATAPETNNFNIGQTVDDLPTTSIFVNNRSDGATRSFPEPMLSARLISNTQYELWRSDTSTNINFRTEVVEWPTAARKLEQNYYRLYVDNGSLKPTDPWPAGATNLGENTEMTADDTPLILGDTVRMRMTISVTSSAMPATLDSFRLQFAERITTCSAATNWKEVGAVGSTTALWRGFNNAPADGAALSATNPPASGDVLISIATVAGTYEEQNSSALNPYFALPGDEVEYDWVLQHNGAKDKTSYCFRMTEADGTQLIAYNNYPVLRTVGYEPVIKKWRWYGDENNVTPVSSLTAGENIAPINVINNDSIKLRVALREKSGAAGSNNKFIVQYSEYSDFSQNVRNLTGTSTCVGDSLWCYANGAGTDNQMIMATVLSGVGSCVSGVGAGCGTHNEGISTVTATHDQPAFSTTEYEFTLQHAGARANAVYYFRLFDVTTNEVLGLDTAATYPSLVTEGAQLVSSVSGVGGGTTIGDITTDVATTPTSIGFGSLSFNNSYEAAQQLAINTNATGGYQLFVYVGQQLTNSYNETIPAITATNALPDAWADACTSALTGCFGYHTTDATLAGGDGRFGPDDSYASLDTIPREIMYSSVPANDSKYMVYRIMVSELQSAGDYTTNISYLSIPVF